MKQTGWKAETSRVISLKKMVIDGNARHIKLNHTTQRVSIARCRSYSGFLSYNSGIPGDSYFKVETNHGVPREERDKIGRNDETHFPPYQSSGRTTRMRRRGNSQNIGFTIDVDVVLMSIAGSARRRTSDNTSRFSLKR